jgi:hypothetical protein
MTMQFDPLGCFFWGLVIGFALAIFLCARIA